MSDSRIPGPPIRAGPLHPLSTTPIAGFVSAEKKKEGHERTRWAQSPWGTLVTKRLDFGASQRRSGSEEQRATTAKVRQNYRVQAKLLRFGRNRAGITAGSIWGRARETWLGCGIFEILISRWGRTSKGAQHKVRRQNRTVPRKEREIAKQKMIW